MEVVYAPKEDELHIYFPMFSEGSARVEDEDENYHVSDTQCRFAYSFEYKNWRIESFLSAEYE